MVKQIRIHINKKRFLQWYFADTGEFEAIGEQAFATLKEGKEFKISLNGIFSNVGYLPISVVMTKDRNLIDEDDCADEFEIERVSHYKPIWV